MTKWNGGFNYFGLDCFLQAATAHLSRDGRTQNPFLRHATSVARFSATAVVFPSFLDMHCADESLRVSNINESAANARHFCIKMSQLASL